MCDYSLHTEPNRLAQEGETLVLHRFRSWAKGLCSVSDAEKSQNYSKPPLMDDWDWSWSAIKRRLCSMTAAPPVVTAVCIPPGARLSIQGIPRDLQKECNSGPEAEVVFTQLSAEAYMHRDAVKFPNGKAISLQRLPEGLRVQVLSLEEAREETREEAAELVRAR